MCLVSVCGVGFFVCERSGVKFWWRCVDRCNIGVSLSNLNWFWLFTFLWAMLNRFVVLGSTGQSGKWVCWNSNSTWLLILWASVQTVFVLYCSRFVSEFHQLCNQVVGPPKEREIIQMQSALRDTQQILCVFWSVRVYFCLFCDFYVLIFVLTTCTFCSQWCSFVELCVCCKYITFT